MEELKAIIQEGNFETENLLIRLHDAVIDVHTDDSIEILFKLFGRSTIAFGVGQFRQVDRSMSKEDILDKQLFPNIPGIQLVSAIYGAISKVIDAFLNEEPVDIIQGYINEIEILGNGQRFISPDFTILDNGRGLLISTMLYTLLYPGHPNLDKELETMRKLITKDDG